MRELIVIGAGPVGLATAIHAARAGLGVRVLEAGSLPQEKPCGEGLMPSGVRQLREMGVNIDGQGLAFDGIRYISGPHRAEATFGDQTFGLGIRRIRLSSLLMARALDLGVQVHPETSVRALTSIEADQVRVVTDEGIYLAKHVVGADGLNSRVRQMINIPVARGYPPRAGRYGWRRHYRCRPWTTRVEVYWGDEIEAYVTPVSEDEIGLAFLFSTSSAGKRASFSDHLHRFPELEARIGDAPAVSEPVGRGPFRQRARRVFRGRVVLVGDAAFYLDALSGEGVALGFRNAKALVRTLIEGRDWSFYASSCSRASRRYRLMTELLLLMAASAPLRERAIATFSKHPDVFQSLLRIYHDELPLRSLGFRRLSLMLKGLVVPHMRPTTR